ncbi:MAG TPA: hypothetical protein VMU39_28485 [Solirubrobacteraceae bacterium]|nr:hypothetical protein [Solirubrobacteraceae bacterium]
MSPRRHRILLVALTLALAPSVAPAARAWGLPSFVNTVAGGNGAGYSGDGSLATGARLNAPAALATDTNPIAGTYGTMYPADSGNCTVRQVSAPYHVISRWAGTGTCHTNTSAGDESSMRTQAPPGHIHAIAVDNAHDVFIADPTNCTVWEYDNKDSIFSARIATGYCPAADWIAAGPRANAAQVNVAPTALAADDNGTVYVADGHGNGAVYSIAKGASTLTGLAGGGSTVAQAGTAASAAELSVSGLAADMNGDVFIAAAASQSVLELGKSASAFTVAYQDPSFQPAGLAVSPDSDLLLVSDSAHNSLFEVSAGSATTLTAPSAGGYQGDGGDPSGAHCTRPLAYASTSPDSPASASSWSPTPRTTRSGRSQNPPHRRFRSPAGRHGQTSRMTATSPPHRPPLTTARRSPRSATAPK